MTQMIGNEVIEWRYAQPGVPTVLPLTGFGFMKNEPSKLRSEDRIALPDMYQPGYNNAGIARDLTPTRYRFIAGRSRAIRNTLDLNRHGESPLADRIHSIRAAVPGLLDPRETEFITLHAEKSHG